MQSDCISPIEDWPTPDSVQEFQVVLSFGFFYIRIIQTYAKVKAPIS